MIWFFERDERRLHYEIRRDLQGDDYEIVINHPDGRTEVERYSDAGQLIERSSSLRVRLMREGWAPPVPGRPEDRYRR